MQVPVSGVRKRIVMRPLQNSLHDKDGGSLGFRVHCSALPFVAVKKNYQEKSA